jgi:hypothetical protein
LNITLALALVAGAVDVVEPERVSGGSVMLEAERVVMDGETAGKLVEEDGVEDVEDDSTRLRRAAAELHFISRRFCSLQNKSLNISIAYHVPWTASIPTKTNLILIQNRLESHGWRSEDLSGLPPET